LIKKNFLNHEEDI